MSNWNIYHCARGEFNLRPTLSMLLNVLFENGSKIHNKIHVDKKTDIQIQSIPLGVFTKIYAL